MPGTPPARGRRPPRPARLRCPRRDAAVPSFRLRFRKRFRVPGLVSRVCRITPLHAGSLTSRGTELYPGSRESPQPGGGQTASPRPLARPACRGLEVNPSLDSSCLRGTLAVSRPRWRPTLATPPARRGVCHQLLQVNSPGRQRAGPPWQGGRLLPIVLGRVWPPACWKRANTPKLSLVSTYVTAAYLVAQPKPEVPKHLSLPGPGGPRRPSEPRWGGSSKGRTAQPGPREHGVCL